MAQTCGPHINAWLGQVKAMMDAAGSLEEFGAMLAAAYPQIDQTTLVADLAEGFAAAHLAGMAEVQGEVK